MSPSPALEELEYALLPVEESLDGRRRFRERRRVVGRSCSRWTRSAGL
jgi:hypothetical protein